MNNWFLIRMLRLYFRIFHQVRELRFSIKRKFWLSYYCNNSQGSIIIDKTIKWNIGFYIQYDLSKIYLNVDKNVQFRNNCNILIHNNGRVIIHENVFFNNNCSINGLGFIEVGANCQFGENVKLYDHNHQYRDSTKPISQQGYSIGTIKIGNNCWIASNVTILKDVEIGDNVIIGAGCIIYKSIPSNSIVINKQELLIKQNIQSESHSLS